MNRRILHYSHFVMTGIALLLALSIVGCGRDEETVVVRNVPKQPEPHAPSTMPSMAMAGASAAGTAQAKWELAAGWKGLPGDGSMRFATIQVDPAHAEVVLTVIPLPTVPGE